MTSEFIDAEIEKQKAEMEKQKQDYELRQVRAEFNFAEEKRKEQFVFECSKCKTPNSCVKPGICADCMMFMSWNSYLKVYGSV